MTEAGWAVQKAIVAKLVSDPGVLAAVGAPQVFDDIPYGNTFPYIAVGQTIERDWSTGTEAGSEHLVTLHVWSRAPGRHEAQNIIGAIHSSLHDQSLTLDGNRLVNLRQDYADVRRDPDGETFHGVVRLQAVTEPA